jgi:hypothetical protein
MLEELSLNDILVVVSLSRTHLSYCVYLMNMDIHLNNKK